MPERREIVINTGPIIALIAALGDLQLLRDLYRRVVVPYEVGQEILAANASRFAAAEFDAASWLKKRTMPTPLSSFLRNALDPGEASVIQLATEERLTTVCIDETVGRRMARLCGLQVTGSLGILMRAKKMGRPISLTEAMKRMRDKGVWLGSGLERIVLRESAEQSKQQG